MRLGNLFQTGFLIPDLETPIHEVGSDLGGRRALHGHVRQSDIGRARGHGPHEHGDRQQDGLLNTCFLHSGHPFP